MKILADENLYEPIVDYLRSLGHDVVRFRGADLSGSPDDDIYRRAVADDRLIVTMDKDFLRMQRFPPDECGGIVVVKIYRWTVAEATRLFKQHFETLDQERVKGRLTIIIPDGVRQRSPRA